MGSRMVLGFLKKLKKKERKEEESKTEPPKPAITHEFKIIEVDNKQYVVRDVKSITPDEIVVEDLDGVIRVIKRGKGSVFEVR